MVICRFFLQGTCKFGNNCRFEHQIKDASQGSSILRQTNQNPAPTGAMEPNTLVRSVVNDMKSAEQGKQWIFSSYSPFKDKPAFPGFEDRSFEEIRLGFYEGTQNGTVEQYKQMVQLLYQESMGRIKTLQNPNDDIVKLLTQIYNAPVGNQNAGFQNQVFNNQSMFGGNVQNSNPIFGGNTPQGDSIFGGVQHNSVFAQKSIFAHNVGNNPPFPNNQSIFTNTNSGNVNKINYNPNQSSSIFAQNTNNAFGQNNLANNPQNSIFGNNTIFNNKQNQQIPFIPSYNPQPTPFVNPTPQPSPFGNAPQPSPFNNMGSNQNNPQTIFGNVTNNQISNTPFQTNTNPIFSGSLPAPVVNNAISNNQTSNVQINPQHNPLILTQPTQNVFAQNPVFGNSILSKTTSNFGGQEMQAPTITDESWYSKLEELSAEDIKSFESEEFEFGKIPERPPTLQMCF